MTKEEYIQLYEKYLTGFASPEEIQLLFDNKENFEFSEFDNNETIPGQGVIKNRIHSRISESILRSRKNYEIGRNIWFIAAAIALITFCLFYSLYIRKPAQNATLVKTSKAAGPIVPGGNKAILILGNGHQVNLNGAANGYIAGTGNLKINKIKDGELVYDQEGADGDAVVNNTIITPKGGQYKVHLPDGTTVWLNAASSLHYPTAFTGSLRHVDLKGEAYFEVAKDKAHPFIVSAGKVEIKVLGTHFNISAYEDDAANKTTLLEGSVQLTSGNHKMALVPGQQAVSENSSGNVQLKTVNVDDAVAWRNGYFSFKKESLKSAMAKISRWYDVDVEYRGEINNKMLGGTASRTDEIRNLISYLELTGIAHFQMEGRRIIVTGH